MKQSKKNQQKSVATKKRSKKSSSPQNDHPKRRILHHPISLPATKKQKPNIVHPDDSTNTDPIPIPDLINNDPHCDPHPQLTNGSRDAQTKDEVSAQKMPSSIYYLPSPLAITLSDQFHLTSFNILTSTKMNSKVTQVLEILKEFPPASDTKNSLVLLRARSKACVKLISIVEIIKREISQVIRGKWYQYTVLDQVLEENQSTNKKVSNLISNQDDGGNSDEVDKHGKTDSNDSNNLIDNEEDEAFETMKTPFERAIFGAPQKRVQPILNIYLSRTRIENIRMIHGEQTNE